MGGFRQFSTVGSSSLRFFPFRKSAAPAIKIAHPKSRPSPERAVVQAAFFKTRRPRNKSRISRISSAACGSSSPMAFKASAAPRLAIAHRYSACLCETISQRGVPAYLSITWFRSSIGFKTPVPQAAFCGAATRQTAENFAAGAVPSCELRGNLFVPSPVQQL